MAKLIHNCQRQNNEDAFIAQQTADGKYIIACVIDGVGGYSGGEVAAAIAHDVIIQSLNRFKGEVIPALVAALADVEAPTAADVYNRLRQAFPLAPLSARVGALATLMDLIRRPAN